MSLQSDNKPFDERTGKRMQEHIKDEKDEITEADIRNIKTGDDVDESATDMPAAIVEEGKTEEDVEGISTDDTIKDDSDPKDLNTSWGVLGS